MKLGPGVRSQGTLAYAILPCIILDSVCDYWKNISGSKEWTINHLFLPKTFIIKTKYYKGKPRTSTLVRDNFFLLLLLFFSRYFLLVYCFVVLRFPGKPSSTVFYAVLLSGSGSGTRGSGTFQSPGSGSLKSKTSTNIIKKSYQNFPRKVFFLLKKCNMAIFYYYINDLRVKILYQV